MSQNDGIRRYIEAAMALTQITRSRAEEMVRELMRTGEVESNQARDWVEDLVRTSKQRSEAFASTVRQEVRRQLSDLGFGDINDLARRVADILDKAGKAARRAGAPARPSKRAATKAPARKASATRKAATKKKAAPARKAATKKKAAGSSAARRRS